MRVLRFFVRFILIVTLAAVGISLFGGLVALEFAVQQLTDDLTVIVENARGKEAFTQQCADAPGSGSLSIPTAFQLRFISPTRYQIEAVCSLIPDAPLLLEERQLPPFVRVRSGDSGMRVSTDADAEQSRSIVLQALNKTYAIVLTGNKIVTRRAFSGVPTSIPQGEKPPTVCTGLGFTCCHVYAQRGVGNLNSNALDCPTSCFAACEPLPYFDAFNAEPLADTNRRIMLTSTNQEVMFTYTVASPSLPIRSIQISYGDGTQDTATEPIGLFTHTYACPTTCAYTVTLRVTDQKGRVSVENEWTTFYIERKVH